jgi:hypothetical protein
MNLIVNQLLVYDTKTRGLYLDEKGLLNNLQQPTIPVYYDEVPMLELSL